MFLQRVRTCQIIGNRVRKSAIKELKATIPDSTPQEGTHVDDIHEVPDGHACRVCSAGWRAQESLEIFIACQTRLKVQFVGIVYLYWTLEDSSRSPSDEQDPCLETRKIHIFDYNLSPVGGEEEVKCMVRRKGFFNLDQLKLRHKGRRGAVDTPTNRQQRRPFNLQNATKD
jgi:hypothetical protein